MICRDWRALSSASAGASAKTGEFRELGARDVGGIPRGRATPSPNPARRRSTSRGQPPPHELKTGIRELIVIGGGVAAGALPRQERCRVAALLTTSENRLWPSGVDVRHEFTSWRGEQTAIRKRLPSGTMGARSSGYHNVMAGIIHPRRPPPHRKTARIERPTARGKTHAFVISAEGSANPGESLSGRGCGRFSARIPARHGPTACWRAHGHQKTI